MYDLCSLPLSSIAIENVILLNKAFYRDIVEDEIYILNLFPTNERDSIPNFAITSFLELVTAQKATFAMACFNDISLIL